MKYKKRPLDMLDEAVNLLEIFRGGFPREWQQKILGLRDTPEFGGVRMRAYMLVLLRKDEQNKIFAMMSAVEKRKTEALVAVAAKEIRRDEKLFRENVRALKGHPFTKLVRRLFRDAINKAASH